MKSEIISIGTELLLGEILDSNAQYLAKELASLGIDLYHISTVGDNYERLLGVLRRAWDRSDLILTSGGLGPTRGDITRETIAGLVGEEPRVDEALKQEIEDFFKRRGMRMSLNNIRQAVVIPSSTPVRNPNGTAPGWWVEKEGRIIVSMPGPPNEMQVMWQNEVAPRLQKRTGAVILSRMLKTYGLSESSLEEKMASFVASANPTLATYVKHDGIYVRIAAKAKMPEEARKIISKREAEVRAALDDWVWGFDDDTQEGVVGKLLTAKGLTLGVAESFSAGYLSFILAGAPQSQNYFKGGLITISTEAKIALGLDPRLAESESSAEVARAMATLARRKLNASIGIGIEGGVESIDGAMMEKVFVAIDDGQKRQVESYMGRPNMMRRRAAYHALFDLRKLLLSR